MSVRQRLFLALPTVAAAFAIGVACSGPDTANAAGPGTPGPSAGGTDAADPVAAVVAGEPVRLSEVDEGITGQLASLEQEMYDLRRAQLKQLVERRLFEAEAKARGISVDELVKIEISDKADEVSEEAMTQLYEQHKARLRGRSREEMAPQLFLAVKDRNESARRKEFAATLAERADVQMVLSPPRADIHIPDGAPVLGDEAADVTIVAFSDYQCPYCHRAQSTVEELLDQYQGRVKLVHMDFPLNIHPGAIPAARAARCAGEQDRFWEYHRNLLSELTDFSKEDLMRRAKALGLDEQPFESCLASDRYDAVIDAGFDEGQQLGVSATPTFFINGRRIQGAVPLEQFAEIIDEELARNRS